GGRGGALLCGKRGDGGLESQAEDDRVSVHGALFSDLCSRAATEAGSGGPAFQVLTTFPPPARKNRGSRPDRRLSVEAGASGSSKAGARLKKNPPRSCPVAAANATTFGAPGSPATVLRAATVRSMSFPWRSTRATSASVLASSPRSRSATATP